MVCESGMRVIDSCSGQPLELLGCYIALEAAESTEARLSPVSLDSMDSPRTASTQCPHAAAAVPPSLLPAAPLLVTLGESMVIV